MAPSRCCCLLTGFRFILLLLFLLFQLELLQLLLLLLSLLLLLVLLSLWQQGHAMFWHPVAPFFLQPRRTFTSPPSKNLVALQNFMAA